MFLESRPWNGRKLLVPSDVGNNPENGISAERLIELFGPWINRRPENYKVCKTATSDGWYIDGVFVFDDLETVMVYIVFIRN
jgi:hypothetical protein